MRGLRGSLLVLSLFLVLAAGLQAQGSASPVWNRNLVYYSDGVNALHLDIAGPAEAEGPLPAVIFLPPPSSGARARFADQLPIAVKKGYVGVTLEYHSLEITSDQVKAKYPFPTQLFDLKRAITWLRTNAEKYHVDASQIGLVGWDYGGYLALMAGFTGPGDKLEPSDSSDDAVQAVACLAGWTDWTKVDDTDAAWSLGGTADEIPGIYEKASPLAYVKADNPPVFLLYGGKDQMVPPEQGDLLARKLAEAGVKHSMLVINEADHLDVSNYAAKQVVWNFFDETLKHVKPEPSAEPPADASN